MTSSSGVEPEHPSIPRYWWLKRISALSVTVLLLLSVVRLVWGWDANRRLEAALAEIRARGEPIGPADFVTPHVPDEQNYVHYFEQATAAIDPKVESPAQSDVEFESYPPYPPLWHAMAKAAMEASPNAIRIARQARAHPQADWRATYASPMLNSAYDPRFTGARNLANLLSDTALYQHLQGNDAEAIELILDVLAMADATHESPSLVSYLVATGLDALASNRALLIAPALRVDVGTTRDAGQTVRPATREQIRTAIERFLDNRHAAKLGRALQFERLLVLDTMQFYPKHNLLLHPMYTMDTLVILEHFEKSIDSINRDSVATVRAKFPPEKQVTLNIPGLGPKPETDIRSLPRELSSIFNLSPVRTLEISLQRRADDLMAAVSLAVVLYRADHQGAWPASLDALVPDYLPGVPKDPFSESARPLQYVFIRESTRPIVYSIGTDGIDDTAAGATIPPEPQFESNRTPDLWRDLSRFDPPPAQSQ